MTKRNGTIDLMRFIFIWCIVFHHSGIFFTTMPGGYIGVEFFFLVSGWLMCKKVELLTFKSLDVGIITRQFILKN